MTRHYLAGFIAVVICPGLAHAQVSSPRLSIVLAAGSLDPAPFWQGGWTTDFSDSKARKTPELSGGIRLALDHGKSLELGMSHWRVDLTHEYHDPFAGYSEVRLEIQRVVAFEASWLKRFGTARAAFFAGGGPAISDERVDTDVTLQACTNAITREPCPNYSNRHRQTSFAIGQGVAGLDLVLTSRVRVKLAYRVQARNVGRFEFGGVYHGVSAGVAIGIR